jgi:exodeoxyribonuclease VII large subunit
MAVGQMVMREQSRFDLWQKTIELHSPERIFRMGYSLTTVNGNLVHRLEDVQAGDVLQTYLQDGVIESVVK